jgi:hypothetical protein
MEIPFAFGGDRGAIRAEVVPNDDPVAVGKSERDRGMPMCTATVEFAARGYRSLLGWVQLVRDTGQFTVDPFDLFEDSTAPFCWYGFRPTLFDAPSRRHTGAVHWTAHSFLTIGPWDTDRRSVVPLAAFSWGYRQHADGRLDLSPVRELELSVWETHRPYLAGRYPAWRF